jgi:hypothetical protein
MNPFSIFILGIDKNDKDTLELHKKPLSKKAKEKLEEITRKAEERLKPNCSGCGIIIERSNCCGAKVVYSKGGVKIPYCSKCGKEYKPFIIKNNY